MRLYSGVDGEVLWTEQLRSDDEDYANALAVGGDGSVFIAGYTDGKFGAQGQVNAGWLDAYVAKFSSDHELEWVRQFGTSGFESWVVHPEDR